MFGVGSPLQLRRDVGHERATLRRGESAQVHCGERLGVGEGDVNWARVHEGVAHKMGCVGRTFVWA